MLFFYLGRIRGNWPVLAWDDQIIENFFVCFFFFKKIVTKEGFEVLLKKRRIGVITTKGSFKKKREKEIWWGFGQNYGKTTVSKLLAWEFYKEQKTLIIGWTKCFVAGQTKHSISLALWSAEINLLFIRCSQVGYKIMKQDKKRKNCCTKFFWGKPHILDMILD